MNQIHFTLNWGGGGALNHGELIVESNVLFTVRWAYKQEDLVYVICMNMYVPFVPIIASKDPQVVLVNCRTMGRSCRRQSTCKKKGIIAWTLNCRSFLLNF